MNYKILYDDPDKPLLERLMKIRNVETPIEKFLNPSIQYYRKDPFLLSDMDLGVKRILQAIENKEKIMIFGDYDVDGVTSSYILYYFLKNFLKHKSVSIMYPHRRHDGYGLKTKHIDKIKKKGVKLIITVDNGITSIEEALYAKKNNIDLIITDHHKNLEQLPQAHAVINPHTSPQYKFNGLCGAGVTFKVIIAILESINSDKEKKKKAFHHFLPIVAIATVADCVPLINENRAFVKRGLQLINNGTMPKSLENFIKNLNIKGNLNTFHIGFLIGPRINAGGRIETPYDSLYTLLYEGKKQNNYLEKIEDINTLRKKLQDDAYKDAKKRINNEKKILIACNKDYHEGVVGIVAGRITEEYNKPSIVLYINEEQNTATGSLRGPDYFNVIEMLQTPDIAKQLKRYGGHKQAGGLTTSLDNLDNLIKTFEDYCEKNISTKQINKITTIDTKLHSHDCQYNEIKMLQKLEPFGVGNQEPTFLIENSQIKKIDTVGKKEIQHLKLQIQHGDQTINSLFWKKGSSAKDFSIDMRVDLVGKIQNDQYNGGRYLEGKEFSAKN